MNLKLKKVSLRFLFFPLFISLLSFLALFSVYAYLKVEVKSCCVHHFVQRSEGEFQLLKSTLSEALKNFDYLAVYRESRLWVRNDPAIVKLNLYEFLESDSFYSYSSKEAESLPPCDRVNWDSPCLYCLKSPLKEIYFTPVYLEVCYKSDFSRQLSYITYRALFLGSLYAFSISGLAFWAYLLLHRRIKHIATSIKERSFLGFTPENDELSGIERNVNELLDRLAKDKRDEIALLTITTELLSHLISRKGVAQLVVALNSSFKEKGWPVEIKKGRFPNCYPLSSNPEYSFCIGEKLPKNFWTILMNLVDTVILAMKEKEKNREFFLQAVEAFANAIDAISPWTKGHSQRVATISRFIGEKLGLSEKELETLEVGALLHDVGKIAVPKEILDKKGKPTPEEWELIKEHPEVGYRILSPMEAFRDALPIVLQHHEKCDGSGYPQGLKCDEINKLAKIVAVADVIEAMTARRPYKEPHDFEEVLNFLKESSGKLFDEKVVQVVLENAEQLREILFRSRGDEELERTERGDRPDRQGTPDPLKQEGEDSPGSGGD
jgi:HD-GYP domain-containing protein (c-di-GMP phosphodiesterase class II)